MQAVPTWSEMNTLTTVSVIADLKIDSAGIVIIFYTRKWLLKLPVRVTWFGNMIVSLNQLACCGDFLLFDLQQDVSL